MSFKIPAELRYLKTHEWVMMKEDGEAVVGITDYAQHALGDIVYLDLPDITDEFEANEIFGVIESVKASSDLFMPVGGKITNVNVDLLNDQTPIKEDPYGAGWMLWIKPSGQEAELMSAAEYEAYIASLKK